MLDHLYLGIQKEDVIEDVVCLVNFFAVGTHPLLMLLIYNFPQQLGIFQPFIQISICVFMNEIFFNYETKIVDADLQLKLALKTLKTQRCVHVTKPTL